MQKLLHERLRDGAQRTDLSFYLETDKGKVAIKSCDARIVADEIERDYVPREQHEEDLRKAHKGCEKPLKFIRKGIKLDEDWVEPQDGESFKHYIDRCYIPRPRFEDGEPIPWDGEFYNGCSASKLVNFMVGKDGDYYLNDYVEDPDIGLDHGEFVKRPTAKVLDADGVEIKVGDTVYLADDDGSVAFEVEALPSPGYYQAVQVVAGGVHTSYDPPRLTHEKPVLDSDGVPCKRGDEVWDLKGLYDVPLTVLEPDDDGSVKVTIPDGKGYTGFDACNLTHDKPVFDADGVRICKGDTVWHVDGSNPWKVVKINGTTVVVEDPLCSHDTEGFDAKKLTHREPDSLEKLRDDMLNFANNEEATRGDLRARLYNSYDRLTALIERGA